MENTWGSVKLNNGLTIPQLAFGSAGTRSSVGVLKTVDNLVDALKAGFTHVDTAQQYTNEAAVGEAIKQSGISRDKLWITTKWSDGDMTPLDSCKASLAALQVEYIDMYVIHHTWTPKGQFAEAWKQMEELVELGYVKSIGLSAFWFEEVSEVLKTCKITPAMNMILYNPNMQGDMASLLELMEREGIALGAYSPIKPLWEDKSSTTAEVATRIASAKGASPDQVLLAWCQAKNAVVFTSSTATERMKGYIEAGRLWLSSEEIKALDEAGMSA